MFCVYVKFNCRQCGRAQWAIIQRGSDEIGSNEFHLTIHPLGSTTSTQYQQNQGSHGALSWPLFWPLIVYLREVKALITLELNSTVNRRVNTTKYEYECVCAVICIRV